MPAGKRQTGKRPKKTGSTAIPVDASLDASNWAALLDFLPDPAAIIGPDRKILRANKSLQKLLKKSPRKLENRICYRCLHGSGKPHKNCPHEMSMKDGKEHTAEVYERFLGAHFLVTTKPVRNAKGRFLGSLHVMRNISKLKQAEKELQEKGEFFRSIATLTPNHIVVHDRDLRYRLVMNPQLGLSEKDYLGKTDFDILDHENAAKLTAVKKRVLKTGRRKHFATTLPGPDGQPQYYDGYFVPRTGPDGQPDGIIGYFRNVTEQKYAQEILQVHHEIALALGTVSERKLGFRRILDILLKLDGVDSGGIYLTDADRGGLDLVAHRGLSENFVSRVSRYPRTSPNVALLEKGVPVFMKYKSFPNAARDPVRIQEGLKAIAIIPVRHKNRILASMNISSRTVDEFPPHVRNILETAGGLVGGFLVRLNAEEESRQERENLDTLFQSVTDMVFILDQDGNILAINSAVERILGYKLPDIAGRPVTVVHPPERSKEVRSIVSEILRGKTDFCPVPLISKNGKKIPVETKVTRGNWNGLPAFFGVSRDISERLKAQEAIRKQEIRVRSIIETAMDAFWIVGNDARIIEVNESACRMSGYSREELVRMRVPDLEARESAEDTRKHFRKILETGSDRFETVHRRKNGEIIHVEVSVQKAEFGNGFMFAFLRDITAQKAAAERINTLAQMADNAPSSISVHDFEGRFLYANRATTEWHGYTLEEFLKLRLQDIDVPESAALIESRMREINARGEAAFEVWHRRKDGTSFPLAVTVKKMNWSGTPVMLSIATDITEREKAEQAVRESEEKYRELVENANSVIIKWDRNGRLTFFNEFAEKFFGYTGAEIMGRSVMDTIVPPSETTGRDLSGLMDQIQADPDRFMVNENENITKDGRRVWVRWNNKAEKDANGNVTGILSVGSDITERKKTENELIRSRELLSGMTSQIPGVAFQFYARPDGTMGFYYISSRSEAVAGLKPEPDGFLERFVELILPEYREDLLQSIRESVRDMTAWHFEGRLKKPAGETIWFVGDSVPTRRETETVFNGYFQDITDRNKAEEALRESESRVRAKLDAILTPEGDMGRLELSDIIDTQSIQSLMDYFYKLTRIGIGIVDMNGRVLVQTGWQDICTKYFRKNAETCRNCMESDLQLSSSVEPGRYKIYKCKNLMWDIATPIVIGGQKMGNLFLGQFFFAGEKPDREEFRKLARQHGFDESGFLQALEQVPVFEKEAVDSAMGFYIRFALLVSTLSYGNIRLAQTLAEQKRIEEALRESEERLRLAHKATNDVVWDWDVIQDTQRWNEAGRHVFGWTEIVERPVPASWWVERVHPEDRQRVDDGFFAVVNNPRLNFWHDEYRFRKSDGTFAQVMDRGFVIRDATGKATRMIGAMLDVTERKKAEEELKRFNIELADRVAHAVSELREKDQMMILQSRQAAMGEMLGNIAHQWRQPLNAIGIHVQNIMAREKSGSLDRDYLEKTATRTMDLVLHMSRTIDDFRNFFKPDKEKISFSLKEAAESALSFVSASYKDNGIESSLDCPGDIAVSGYPNEFSQALLNILNNALDMIKDRKTPNPRVTVRIGRDRDRAVLTVTDNAGGIRKDAEDRLFEPFFTTKEMGTGIGLFMAKTIIEKNMGGKLTARNVGDGAEFRFEI